MDTQEDGRHIESSLLWARAILSILGAWQDGPKRQAWVTVWSLLPTSQIGVIVLNIHISAHNEHRKG